MPRPFHAATAEQAVAAAEAVVVHGDGASVDFVEEFTQMRRANAESALRLAADMRLLVENGGLYSSTGLLPNLIVTRNQARKAAIVRLVLEEYEPFTCFRRRLATVDEVDAAAHQTKTLLDLDAHRDEIKDTLVNLGTYAQALVVERRWQILGCDYGNRH